MICLGLLCGWIAIPAMANAESGDSRDPQVLQQAALTIDQHVAAFYRKKQLTVPEVVHDEKFLRRAYLTIVGRIPTADEARGFLESDDAHKRHRLVAGLLDSSGYGSHMTNWLFDLIRFHDRKDRISLKTYRHWIRTAIEENMPWDQFTHRIIASEGRGWDSEQAAVGYYVRDQGMPHDNLANSMRIFLGKRMECAQCHDDPFGTTKRRDFYQLAAFTNDIRPMNRHFIQPILSKYRDAENRRSLEYQLAQMLEYEIFNHSIQGGGSGRIRVPYDYQYRNARPGDILAARTPFGRTVRMSINRNQNDGRQKLAEWMTGRTDHQFSAVIANRMWRRVMGQGLVEPVDEFVPIESTHHPALFKYLAELMVKLDYDLKAFQQVLLMTRTYQFETNPDASSIQGGDDFHGRRLQRLSAEQLWDSLVTLATGEPDPYQSLDLDDTVYLNGRPILVGVKTMSQLSEEIHALKDEKKFQKYFNELISQVKEASSSAADGGGSDSMMAGSTRKQRTGMVRASELPSPPPHGHFLSLFGASDREVVDAASREPNVGQVLSLMNGIVQRELIEKPDSALFAGLADMTEPSEQIRALCLAILSRYPSEDEMEWMLAEVTSRDAHGIRNLAAALVMSSEFLFLQ